MHTHKASQCLLTQTWRVTQSYPRGWHWGPDDSPGGRCLCACKEAGPRCCRDHPSQKGQQSNNAPSRLRRDSPHHGKHPGPARNKTTGSSTVILHVRWDYGLVGVVLFWHKLCPDPLLREHWENIPLKPFIQNVTKHVNTIRRREENKKKMSLVMIYNQKLWYGMDINAAFMCLGPFIIVLFIK